MCFSAPLAFPVPERDVCAGDELKPATSPSRFSVMLSEKRGGWWWIITHFCAPVQTVTPLLNNFPLAVAILDAIWFCKWAEDVLVRRDAVLPNQCTDDTEHGSIRGGPGRAQKYDLGSEEGGLWFLEEWQSSSLSRPYYGLTCLRGWTEAFMKMVQVRLHVGGCLQRQEGDPAFTGLWAGRRMALASRTWTLVLVLPPSSYTTLSQPLSFPGSHWFPPALTSYTLTPSQRQI